MITDQMIKLIDGNGSSSDNPIIIKCVNCNNCAAINFTEAHCFSCSLLFSYEYKVNKWYLSYHLKHIRIIRFIAQEDDDNDNWDLETSQLFKTDVYFYDRFKETKYKKEVVALLIGENG